MSGLDGMEFVAKMAARPDATDRDRERFAEVFDPAICIELVKASRFLFAHAGDCAWQIDQFLRDCTCGGRQAQSQDGTTGRGEIPGGQMKKPTSTEAEAGS